MTLAGRLPPIDVDNVIKAMEEIYADWVYATRSSSDAEWWERTTALNCFRYINVAREKGLPVSLETIQFFRASLLYDSIVVRLDKSIDPVAEWKSYTRVAGKEARRRVAAHREAARRADQGRLPADRAGRRPRQPVLLPLPAQRFASRSSSSATSSARSPT